MSLQGDNEVRDLDIFESVLLFEEKLQMILNSFLGYDCLQNYRRIWSAFVTKDIIPSLSKWINFTNLLYSRYFDEYQKEKEELNVDHPIFEVLSNIIKVKIEMAILLKQYIEYVISMNPTEPISPEIISALLDAENMIKESTFLFFNNSTLRNSLDPIIETISVHNEYIMDERLERIVNDYSSSENFHISTSLRLNLAENLLSGYPEIFKSLSDDWWFVDHLINYQLVNNGIKIIEDVNKNKKSIQNQKTLNRVDKLMVVEYPAGNSSINLTLANFEIIKGLNVSSQGNFVLASEIFRQSLKHLEKVFLTIGTFPASENLRDFNLVAEQKYNLVSLYLALSQMNAIYKSVVLCLETDDSDGLSKYLGELDREIQSFIPSIDIPYISAIIPIFGSIASTIELMINIDKSGADTINRVEKIITAMGARVLNASEQIQHDFIQLSNEDPNIIKGQISKIKDEIEILRLTLIFLPTSSSERYTMIKRLDAMRNLALSIELEVKSANLKENKLIELIYKAKSHYYAKKAFSFISELDDKLPVNRIKAHYSGTLISGYTIQIELSKHILQFLCLNELLPRFYMVLSHDNSIINDKEKERRDWETRLYDNEQFSTILQGINQASQLLLDHKKEKKLSISGVDWAQIESINAISKGLSTLFQSVIEAILGVISQSLALKEDVILHTTNAKNRAFEAAEQLQILATLDTEIKDAPSMIFNYAKYCQQVISSPLQIQLLSLPITELFKLFRNIVFAL